jgi:hemerythrin
MTAEAAAKKMPPLAWASAFETGDARIDEEHRSLLVDINDLSELLTRGQEWSLVIDKSRQLRDECFNHFDDEERVLEIAKFERLAPHKAEHRFIEQQLDKILTFMKNVTTPSQAETEAALLLRSTLVNHFFCYDIAYKTHLLRLRSQS